MGNLNYLFNKGYYDFNKGYYNYEKKEKDEKKHFKNCNDILVDAHLIKDDSLKSFLEEDECFELKTSYPGLLVGIGNIHESGKGDSEIKLGFSLDYVTGMPYIPGSTVKGTLRSAFKRYPEFVMELLNEKNIEKLGEIEKEIFDNNDVFFDAIITHGNKEVINGRYVVEKILDLDNITPHDDELKDPIPLTMLKVRPNVVFKFRFKFNDSSIAKIKKIKLFKELIETLGIGAKTNTGYGYLNEVED